MKNNWVTFLVFGLLLSLQWACTDQNKTTKTAETAARSTYTCSMHPQVIKNEMGTCPICGMDLVLFQKDSDSHHIKVSDQSIVLANIQTQKVEAGKGLKDGLVLNGQLVLDPMRSHTIAARNAGRVVQLFIRELGIPVKLGDPLYRIYSEELNTLQVEYLLALAQYNKNNDGKIVPKLLEAAKQKLLLYGLSANQIEKLAITKKSDPYLTIYAKHAGWVAEINISDGQYIAEGSPVLRFEDYSRLWVELNAYPADLHLLKKGTPLKLAINTWQDEHSTTTIDFVEPAYQKGSQLLKLRGTVINDKMHWQPGQQVTASLLDNTKVGAFVVPTDAVIRDAKGEHVWLKVAKNRFEARAVKSVMANENQVSIIEGLSVNDELVTKGAYLLYSEYVLRKGKHPLAN